MTLGHLLAFLGLLISNLVSMPHLPFSSPPLGSSRMIFLQGEMDHIMVPALKANL